MANKRFAFSIIQLFFAFAAFIAVSFAWFAVSTMVEAEPLNFMVSHEYIDEYEINFFTNNHVYRYNQSTASIEIYDETQTMWVDPSTTYAGPPITYDTPSYGYLDQIYDFQGIFLNQYDPLIPQNNLNNNLFVELRLSYDIETSRDLIIDARAITSVASNGFGTSSYGPYYLSEVLYLQFMQSNVYAIRSEETNLFADLKLDFAELDAFDEYIYPYFSFYGSTDTYYPEIEIDTITLSPLDTEIILYFNFFYYEDKIEDIILAEAISLPITSENFLRFFQDVMIIIKDGDQS